LIAVIYYLSFDFEDFNITYAPNGLRYLRWGGDGEAVQPEKC